MVHMLKMSSIWINYYKSSIEVQVNTGEKKRFWKIYNILQ